jgi:hypothetical protein
MRDVSTAFSDQASTAAALDEVLAQLGDVEPRAIAFFCAPDHDGVAISRALKEKYPTAENIGCTTAGAFNERGSSAKGLSVVALSANKVRRSAAALARFDDGVDTGIRAACDQLGRALELDLRSADPKRYVGLTLVEGLRMKEEEANDALGNVAPLLSFVGGSAGDALGFKETRVFANGLSSNDGAALLLLDMAVPFTIAKTCSFEPSGRKFTITRADVANRIVYEFNGRPAVEEYARALGLETVNNDVFMSHPVGLMIDGKPWIRSPQQTVTGGGVKFYCRILEGMEVDLMNSTDLIGDTKLMMENAAKELGGTIGGGVVFNCILRRLELDAKNLHGPFLDCLDFPAGGFHTYGESWLGHINQTATALLFA